MLAKLRSLLANPVLYVGLYLACMIPTYILPYMGSNASLLRASARSMGVPDTTLPGLFYLHLAFLVALCVFAYARGQSIGKSWLVVLPLLALVFDLTPVLSLIPLVPTALHLFAVVLGVAGVRTTTPSGTAA